MKRVLKITAKNGGTTAKVRIEVECKAAKDPLVGIRLECSTVLVNIADGVMDALKSTPYLWAPLSRQRVGR